MALEADPAHLARSFGAIAEDYDRFRPGPPAAAIDWVLPQRCETVLDIGAGTGGLTRQLCDRVPSVLALEPDPRMRAVLATGMACRTAFGGQGEFLPLRDGCLDAVMASSSWHWVDEDRAFPEVARVLRPGGVVGLLWTGPNRRVEWVGEFMKGGTFISPEDQTRLEARRKRRHEAHLPDGAPFFEPQSQVVAFTQTMTPEELVGLAGTFSRTIVLTENERAEFLGAVQAVVETHPMIAGRDQVEVPMGSICWRAVRR